MTLASPLPVARPAGVQRRHPHVVTDFVAGLSLAELMRVVRPRKLPPRVVATLFAGALRGLHAVHERSAHRSLSPRAFFLGADGVGRVVPPAVEPRSLVGAAPSGDRRADIYDVGASIWHALTGNVVGSAQIAAPSMFGEDLPFALDTIVMRALSQYPAVRFATALEMAEALENVFVDVPPTHEVAAWLATVAADELRARWNARARLTGAPGAASPVPRHRHLGARWTPSGTRIIPWGPNRSSSSPAASRPPPVAPKTRSRNPFVLGIAVVLVALVCALGLLAAARRLPQSQGARSSRVSSCEPKTRASGSEARAMFVV